MNKKKNNYFLILYDDDCLMCNKFVIRLLNSDKDNLFYVCSLCDAKENFINKKSINVIHNGNIYIKSDAIILLLSVYSSKIKILYLFPKLLRNFIYDVIAFINKIKKKKNKSCVLPPDNIKKKFISDTILDEFELHL
ncbi:TPA: DUF393 domain-containing protein [Staphylococcus pseudintermedius]|nr:DUF393 domain-containing protein [Staphylococcus pseudintermedius]EJA1938812.1 DUF393 domain-containing protein [Staphylococcus pseudintermedius]EJG0090796.1 DUF393 domain-containing protein [Staphylococcus pseudintermedius]HAR6042907.1 DUF393 domain-containing protein [Staphylococcus pseudintermedius]